MTADNELWRKTDSEIQRVIETVRAGADLTPDIWPGKASVAVALSFDVDTETIAIWNGKHSPSSLSRGEFGARAGLPRILDILKEYQLPATFFIPAMTNILHPEVAPSIMAGDLHEIGLHGWVHESIVDIPGEDERALTRRSYDYWTQILGKPPVGIRTPSWDFSTETLSIIQDLDLLYDSSLMADDRPYFLMSRGQSTGIIELPVDWSLDDYMYFQIDSERGYHPYISPEDVFQTWKADFEVARAEGTLFNLTMHPQVIGHRSRIGVLKRLVEYMLGQNAWFATLEGIADYLRITSSP